MVVKSRVASYCRQHFVTVRLVAIVRDLKSVVMSVRGEVGEGAVLSVEV